MSLFRKMERRTLDGSSLSGFARGTSPLLGNSAKSALRLVPLYSATGMIADSISILPMAAYETTSGGRRKLTPQPELVWAPHPNPVFTRVEWLHQFATSFLLRGNAYGLITAVDQAGNPKKVHWMSPDSVKVDESAGIPKYYYNDKPLDLATVLHIPWYPAPGSVVGLSPIGQFKMQIETGYAAGKYGNDWFRNGSMPSGHLKYSASTLDNTQSARIKAKFKEAVEGNDVFVSGNDWDWTAMSVKPDEAQFLQTIKATANQFAAIYRVDPQDIGGESGSSMTYSTLEMNQIKFQTRALQPIFTRLEHHLSRLLPNFQYIKFNPDAIVRTDLKTRMEAHEIALRIGMETQPEGRELEDRPPLTSQEQADWLKFYGNKPTQQTNPKNGGAA
jgi:HK97 family phage portal protein